MMRRSRLFFALGLIFPALLLADPATGESAHYRTVRDHVGEGGQVFVYVDIDGYFTQLGHDLTTDIAAVAGDEPALAMWKQDYAALAADLGLAQLKAVGLSSRPLGPNRYANKIYLHIPEGRSGLLRVFGGSSHPFATAKLAPADTDLFVESEFDLAALYTTAHQLLQRIAPEMASQFPGARAVDAKDPVGEALAAFLKTPGRLTAIVRLQGSSAFTAESSEFKHDILVSLDVGGPQLLGYVRGRHPKLQETKTADGRVCYAFAEKGGLPRQPVVAVEGNAFYFATSAAFLQECLARQTGLPQAPAFQEALAATSAEGNSIVYASPRLFAALHEMTTSLPPLPGYDRKFAVALATLGKRFAKIDAPAVSVTSNLPEGVLVQSVGPQSLRELLPVLGLATPDLAGNILRVSLPAYVAGLQWQASINREEAAIRDNLAKVSAAATAYFAAHADADEVAFAQLLETAPELAQLAPVAGEEYSAITVRRDRDSIDLTAPNGASAIYGRPLTADERKRIEANLALYDEAAVLHFSAHPEATSMSSYEATEAGGSLTSTPESVIGEQYDDFSIERTATEISVRTPGGNTVTYQRVPGIRWTLLKRRVQQAAAIRGNLATFYAAASAYLAAHPDESYVSGYELFGEECERPELPAVAGENYRSVRLNRNSAVVSIEAPGVGPVVYEAELPAAQADAIQANLRKLAKAAASYFKKHRDEKLVVAGELFAAGTEKPVAVAGEDYETLVIENEAASLMIALPTGQKITVPLR